jgi:hypothetical protein
MSETLGIFAIIVMLPTAIMITICLKLMTRGVDRRRPRFKRWVLFSFLAGIFGLYPGLLNSRVVSPPMGFDFFSNLDPSQGWPFYWAGAQGLTAVFMFIPILGDVLVVTLIAFIGFSLISLFLSEVRPNRELAIDLGLAIIFAATPMLFSLPLVLFNLEKVGSATHTTYQMSDQELRFWLNKNAGPVMNSIQLERCSGFQLVPSQNRVFPGVRDIQVSFTAIFKKATDFKLSNYGIDGQLFDLEGNPMGDPQYNHTYSGADDPPKFPNSGQQQLTQVFPVAPPTLTRLNIDKPGPYRMIFTVSNIYVSDGAWDGSILAGPNQGMVYARDTLGFSDKKFSLQCETPAYTLAELGITSSMLNP